MTKTVTIPICTSCNKLMSAVHFGETDIDFECDCDFDFDNSVKAADESCSSNNTKEPHE